MSHLCRPRGSRVSADADDVASGPQQARIITFSLRFPHELSSGQLQLFGLSLVLARPFDVLIVDEPETTT